MQTESATTVQGLAQSYAELFTKDTRSDGQDFWKVDGDKAAGLQSLIEDAHGDMFPDDFKYETIHSALCDIADVGTDDAVDGLEAGVYNSDLLKWLSSDLSRAEYVNEAMTELGLSFGDIDGGVMGMIGLGQIKEKREIYSSVIASLEALASEDVG